MIQNENVCLLCLYITKEASVSHSTRQWIIYGLCIYFKFQVICVYVLEVSTKNILQQPFIIPFSFSTESKTRIKDSLGVS